MKIFLTACCLFLLACQENHPEKRQDTSLTMDTKTKRVENQSKKDLSEGDILFQNSRSPQSEAIQLATHSLITHCGILVKIKGVFYVLEAVQPVKFTPLDQWINQGVGGECAVKRLINRDKYMTPAVKEKMFASARKMLGKNYDLYFGWSDDRIYCSELVWKIYQQGLGIELGKLQRLRDFDLTHPIVKSKLQERYGNFSPMNEKVISPVAIYQSVQLETVRNSNIFR